MTAIRTTVIGADAFVGAMKRGDPERNPEIFSRSLRRITLLTQKIAAQEKMKRGGQGAPLPNKLTSRTGTGRRSISTDFGALPRAASVGSSLNYMRVHEEGGTFVASLARVGAHTRTVVFGRTVSPFTVPAYTRSGYSFKMPRRAWLEPAVDDVLPRAPDIAAEEWERAI